MSDEMKKFGLEFVLKSNADKEFQKIMNQQVRLNRALAETVKQFNKMESNFNNAKFNIGQEKLRKLTNSINEYNRALTGAKSNQQEIGRIATGGSNNAMTKDFMNAEFLMGNINSISQQISGIFDTMPFGNLLGGMMNNLFEGVSMSLVTKSLIPIAISTVTGVLETSMNIYKTSSELVHGAIVSGFQAGANMIQQVLNNFIPQTLQRGYDQTKLGAVLNDGSLASKLSLLGTSYAKNSSLSLQDMDFILPNLVMANKSTGVKNGQMESLVQKELEAVTKLNFKDSGQGAGVLGSLMALQEMISGDYISLQRRFEMGGASIDRIKAAASNGVTAQIDQLNKELESMGVTTGALKKTQATMKGKINYITESITDVFTNPETGLLVSLLKPFDGVINKMVDFFNTGGGDTGNTKYNETTHMTDKVTMLDSISSNFKSLLEVVGNVAVKFGEAFYSGIIMQVDWGGLLKNVSNLLITVSSYFKPSFDILGQWINDTFSPWLAEMNKKLQDKTIRQGILDYIKSLTDIATNSLKLVDAVTQLMPSIAGVTKAIQTFIGGIIKMLEAYANATGNPLTSKVQVPPPTPNKTTTKTTTTPKIFGTGIPGKAVGMPYVPHDNYEVMLHKGERVLTAQQNRNFSNKVGSLEIGKLADTIVIREDADIDKIANAFVRKLKENQLSYGGAY